MKNIKKNAFTLVELLVVITILAIISVVAYQNFWWAVDKAVSGRKISDISTIETSLQQYKVDKNYFPATDENSNSNLWWYNSWATATPSNKIVVTYNWEAISTLITSTSVWGWKVFWTWTWSTKQIWAKWTISRTTLWKKYLTKDLYDPEVWDIKEWTIWKFIDKWIWRYVYAVYKKSKTTWNWTSNMTWTNYNLAFTVKKNWTDTYITKIVWDYDSESCYADSSKCPQTLIWSSSSILIDWQQEWKDNNQVDLATYDSKQDNQWIPYAITDFAQ